LNIFALFLVTLSTSRITALFIMASNPPGKCCIAGVKHEGETYGSIIKIDGVDTYIAEPSGETIHKDAAILFLPDAFSISFNNTQLLADQFAANGYLTIAPDLLKGDAFPVEYINNLAAFDIMKWLNEGMKGEGHTPDVVDPIVENAIEWLKKERGIKKIGSVGYCFGGKYVVRFLKSEKISVGYIAHPSWITSEEISAIEGPLSIAAAEIDQALTADLRHESEEILKKKGHPYQINLYSGVEHGFAVRTDLSIKQNKFAKEQAFFQAVAWFDEWLVDGQ